MSHLQQRISVQCPLAQAAMRIGRFFRESGDAAGDTSRLTLQIDVSLPGLPTPLTLHHPVKATIVAHHLPLDMAPRFRVDWTPEGSAPFPSFSGELVVEGEDDYDTFALRLDGDYTPPLGLVGKGFDAAVGNRVAQATAHDLLDHIRVRIERDYRADETRKIYAERTPCVE